MFVYAFDDVEEEACEAIVELLGVLPAAAAAWAGSSGRGLCGIMVVHVRRAFARAALARIRYRDGEFSMMQPGNVCSGLLGEGKCVGKARKQANDK